MAAKKVEVALLYEDHTWDTEMVEVDILEIEETFAEAVDYWFKNTARKQGHYRNVVQACVYWVPPEDEDG